MAMIVKVAGCPGITNASETGWTLITGGSTAEEGGREGGYEYLQVFHTNWEFEQFQIACEHFPTTQGHELKRFA